MATARVGHLFDFGQRSKVMIFYMFFFLFSGDVLKSRKVFASSFFFLKLFFLFDRIFFQLLDKTHNLETKKNPSLTKVLRKGSTLWAGLGPGWLGREVDEAGILWCSRFFVHPGKFTFGTQKSHGGLEER